LRLEQRIAEGDLVGATTSAYTPILMWPKARPRAATMSRSRLAVTGLTWVAAHLVIGKITRSLAAPRVMSEPIQSCSLQADAPSRIDIRAKSRRCARSRCRSAGGSRPCPLAMLASVKLSTRFGCSAANRAAINVPSE